MVYCYNAIYRFLLYFITLETGLSIGKISSPTPLGDPEVMVIDIELIINLFIIIMLIEYGHSCMMFSFCSASPPPPPLSSPNTGTFNTMLHFDNACMMGKHRFRRAMLSGDSSCIFTAHKTSERACRSPKIEQGLIASEQTMTN